MEADDHDNPALYVRSDGKILAAYSKHNDAGNVHRIRISTNAGDISAWGTEINPPVTVPSYANPHYLSESGLLYVGFRSGSGSTRPQQRITSSDEGATWGTAADWITKADARPYVKACSNGTNRIDLFLSTHHPNEGAASLYHCYMQLDAGVEKFYQSDGTLIGTSTEPENGTLIYDGATLDGWCYDITYGADGRPRVLFTKYESTTDHRYMFSRWTGSVWTTPAQIVSGGSYLYAAEANYSGGMCFDGANPDRVYASVQASGQWEIQDWRTTDSGATWNKWRDITSGSSVKNCRPWSPRGHDGALSVLWWRGTYTSYTNYSTAIWGAG
jgi:hypothetical protein